EPPAAAAVPAHPVHVDAHPPGPQRAHVNALDLARPDALLCGIAGDAAAGPPAGKPPRSGARRAVLVRDRGRRAAEVRSPGQVPDTALEVPLPAGPARDDQAQRDRATDRARL